MGTSAEAKSAVDHPMVSRKLGHPLLYVYGTSLQSDSNCTCSESYGEKRSFLVHE